MDLTPTTQLRYFNTFQACWRLPVAAVALLLEVDEAQLVALAAGDTSLPQECHAGLRDLYTLVPDDGWSKIEAQVTADLLAGQVESFWAYADGLWETRTLDENFAVDFDELNLPGIY